MRNAQDRGEAPLVPTPRTNTTTTMTALGKQVFVSAINEIKQVDQFDNYDLQVHQNPFHITNLKKVAETVTTSGESSLHQEINVINRAIILIIIVIVIIVIINHGGIISYHTVGSHQDPTTKESRS